MAWFKTKQNKRLQLSSFPGRGLLYKSGKVQGGQYFRGGRKGDIKHLVNKT